MGHLIKLAAVGSVGYVVLDGLWLGLPTLRQWPFAVVLVDMGWGMAASAACALLVRLADRW